MLNARLRLEPQPLSIKKTNAGYTGKIEEMFLQMDADGRVLGKYSNTKLFTVDAAYKSRFDARGVTLLQTVPFVEGAVKLLIVVRDTASGRVGSLTVPLANLSSQATRN
jgi:hypothetical protein